MQETTEQTTKEHNAFMANDRCHICGDQISHDDEIMCLDLPQLGGSQAKSFHTHWHIACYQEFMLKGMFQ